MNRKTMSTTLAALIPLATFVNSGCKSDKDTLRSEEAKEMGKTVEPTDSPTATQPSDERFQQERREYVDNMNEDLNQINAKIDSLDSRMESLSGDAKAQMQESINALKDTRDKVKASLNRVRNASSDEWNEVKQSFQRDMSDLRSGYNELLENMKTDE